MTAELQNKYDQLSFVQKQRLAFVDFCLFFRGYISRKELIDKFDMGSANATRDIALYKELAPHNLVLDPTNKTYYQTTSFQPLLQYDARKTLAKLATHNADGFDGVYETVFPVDAPTQLNVPDINIVAKTTQAILNKRPLDIRYVSLSGGESSRTLVPHSIVDNGLRWHLRAFDRKSKTFRDFVLTRVIQADVSSSEISLNEQQQSDEQWLRIIELVLHPHPNNVIHSKAIELDYNMAEGRLIHKVRAALAGYMLRRWNVDCTPDASLDGYEYQLWLANMPALYGAENLAIAPGYSE